MIKKFRVNVSNKTLKNIYKKIRKFPFNNIQNMDGWLHGTNHDYLKNILVILFISFISQSGDLFISYIKRKAKVKDIFKSPKFGFIAGSVVEDGTIYPNKNVRVIRDNTVIHEGMLDSLRRFKDEAKEVKSGTECGIGITNYTDIKEGDIIEVFQREEIQRKL